MYNQNLNPLNLRNTPSNHWQGQTNYLTRDPFCKFRTLNHGLRAAWITMLNKNRRGICTIHDIIHEWAPPSDHNDTTRYIAFVSRQTGIAPHQRLRYIEDHAAYTMILQAMSVMEGTHPVTHLELEEAYEFTFGG